MKSLTDVAIVLCASAHLVSALAIAEPTSAIWSEGSVHGVFCCTVRENIELFGCERA
jgi:hypothetical protein